MTFDQSSEPPTHPIEEWADHELIDQYRYAKAEIADEDDEYLQSEDSPLQALEAEIERRGLEELADDVEPDASTPGRERDDPHESNRP